MSYRSLESRLHRVLHRNFESTPENVRLYHATSALSYAFAREFGWIDPNDMSWLAAEHLKLQDYDEKDTGGFFMEADPLGVVGYITFSGGMFGLERQLLSALGVDYNDPYVQSLTDKCLLIEIDPRAFKAQTSVSNSRHFFVGGHDATSDFSMEIVAPLMPTDLMIPGSVEFEPAKVIATFSKA